MKLFRKYLSLICIMFFFTFVVVPAASAWVPVVVRVAAAVFPQKYNVASASLHVAAIAAASLAQKYIMTSDPATVTKDGKIDHPAAVTWVDLQDVPNLPHKVPVVNENDDIVAHLKPAILDSLVMKKDTGGSSLYPLLKALMFTEERDFKQLQTCTAGDTIQTPYGNKIVTSAYNATPESDLSGAASQTQWGPDYAYVHGPANSAYPGPNPSGYHTVRVVRFPTTTAPLPPLVTKRVPDGTRYNMLTGENTQTGPTKATIKPEYQAEIDKMLKDPDYVPEFNDSNTGQVAVAPSNVLTDAQVKEANAYVQAQQAAAQAAEAADILATEATQARLDAEYARNRATEARSAANGEPNNTLLDSQADQLEKDASYAESKARQAAAAASSGASTASSSASEASQAPGGTLVGAPGGAYPGTGTGEGDGSGEEELVPPALPGDNSYNTDVATPDKKSISTLLTGFVSNSPIASMIRSFTITVDTPVKSISCGTIYGREIIFDFDRYSGTFNTLGGVLLVITHGFAVLVVIRGW